MRDGSRVLASDMQGRASRLSVHARITPPNLVESDQDYRVVPSRLAH